MSNSIPLGAKILLKFIYETETGKRAPDCYEVIYGQRQSALKTPLTKMTVDEVLANQRTWSSKSWAAKFKSTKASSAAGAPQLMRATLLELVDKLNLPGDSLLNAGLQDRLGYELLKRRGFASFMDGMVTINKFAESLAKEWASFPVLVATKGAHRDLKRGQSFYEGDALNKALIRPETVESLLRLVLASKSGVIVDEPAKEEFPLPEKPPVPVSKPVVTKPALDVSISWPAAITIAVVAALGSSWTWIAAKSCTYLNLLCGG